MASEAPFNVERTDTYFSQVMLERWDTTWQDLDDSVNALEEDNTILRKELDGLHTSLSDLSLRSKEKIVNVKASIARYMELAEKAEAVGAEANQELVGAVEASTKRVDAMKTSMDAKEKELARLETKLMEKDALVETMESMTSAGVDMSGGSADEIVDQFKAAQEAKAKAAEEASGNAAKKKAQQDEKKSLMDSLQEWQKKARDAAFQVEELNGQIKALNVEANSDGGADAYYAAQVKAAQTRAETANKKVKAIQAEIAELQSVGIDRDAFLAAGEVVVQRFETVRSNYRKSKSVARDYMAYIKGEFDQDFQDMKNTLGSILGQHAETQRKYKKEYKKRNDLFKEVQDLLGRVRTYVRVRPMTEDELQRTEAGVSISEEGDLEVLNPVTRTRKKYEFEQVFSETSTNEEVYKSVDGFCKNVVEGFNVNVLSYGQSGTGKSFSVLGGGEGGNKKGLLHLALDRVYKSVNSKSKDWTFSVELCYTQVKNDKFTDVLGGNREVAVRRGHSGPVLEGVSLHQAQDKETALSLVERANGMLSHHDRNTHSIFTIFVTGVPNNKKKHTTTYGRLYVIDCAASERGAANPSITALQDAVNALSSKQTANFRVSKFTYFLQTAFSGNSKTIMLFHINPAKENVGETFLALNFASRARVVDVGMASKLTGGDNDLLSEHRSQDSRGDARNRENEAELDRLREASMAQLQETRERIGEKEEEILELRAKVTEVARQVHHKDEEIARLKSLLAEGGDDELAATIRELEKAEEKIKKQEAKIQQMESKVGRPTDGFDLGGLRGSSSKRGSTPTGGKTPRKTSLRRK